MNLPLAEYGLSCTGFADATFPCAFFRLVEFKTAAQAKTAIDTLNMTELDGRQIFLREVG